MPDTTDAAGVRCDEAETIVGYSAPGPGVDADADPATLLSPTSAAADQTVPDGRIALAAVA
ncbi:hypothetical protein [Microbispora sp. H10949]|uniref:hypothetical protein n=1 Tax=Microbispora sp. H10949 TaxID=2729111 RepID=UPI001600048B|nr:hypothetical protein [Microbispora sp. H10949]